MTNNNLTEIAMINIDCTDEEGPGAFIVNLFGEKVGICITKRFGSDVEIWIERNTLEQIITALTEAKEKISID